MSEIHVAATNILLLVLTICPDKAVFVLTNLSESCLVTKCYHELCTCNAC